MFGKNTSILPTFKNDLSDNPFIKDNIFEGDVNFPPRVTPIDIIIQYCEHCTMSYIPQSENNIPCNHIFTARNKTNVWILSIGRKEPTSLQQVLESI